MSVTPPPVPQYGQGAVTGSHGGERGRTGGSAGVSLTLHVLFASTSQVQPSAGFDQYGERQRPAPPSATPAYDDWALAKSPGINFEDAQQ